MESIGLFSLGTVEITDAAAATLAALGEDSATYIARHHTGDWGEVDQRQRDANDFSVRYGHDILSLYRLSDETQLRVETALDHASTRVLLADEYVPGCQVSVREGYAIWSSSYARERNPLIGVEEAQLPALESGLQVATVLDVGTGTGRQALRWARRGARVTAVDQSPEMLAVARQLADADGLAISFSLAAIETGLPVANDAFDLVVCSLMLCHMNDLRAAIGECARAVRSGGCLLITDFHPEAVALGWQADIHRPGIVYRLPTARHARDDYLQSVRESGCEILTIVDATVRDVPEGYTRDEFVQAYGYLPFCLLILARKE